MKYSVKVKEISYGVVEVDATSAEEAEEKAIELLKKVGLEEKAESVYYDGNVMWGNSEVDCTAEPVKERKRDEAR